MNVQRIDLDISKRDALTQMVTIGQGDASGTTIEATVYDNGEQVSLSGKSARFEMRLPDGKSYVRDTNCTVSGSKITYVVDEEHAAAAAGVTDDAYFSILDGETVIYSTNRFRVRVLRSARTDAEPAESWTTEIDELIARGDAAIAAEVSDGQSRITTAITEFDTRQDQNDAAQAENDLMQAKNNADQAINNQSAQGLIAVLLTSDQYDAETRRPTITGEIGKIYLVPRTDGDENDHFIEWMWLNNAWEGVGTTKTAPEAITTDQIDAVIDGEGGTGNQTLSLTGLNYLWAKEVDYFDDNYSGIATKATTGPAYGPLLSVTAKGHAEQNGTPTPSDPKEIVVVRGRNLFDESATPYKQGYVLAANGTEVESAGHIITQPIAIIGGKSYLGSFTRHTPSDTDPLRIGWYDANMTFISRPIFQNSGDSLIAPPNAAYARLSYAYIAAYLYDIQLELGSTAHPYVPYGHVGLDVTADGKTTTTPIPLPSRGWVGSLPDGTHDALAIDGAGKVTWGLADAVVKVSELTFAYDSTNKRFFASVATLGIRGFQTNRLTPILSESFVPKWHGEAYDASWDGVSYIGGDNLVLHARAYDNVTDLVNALASTSFYYPLATPATEDMGYVDLPDIPDGAVVSMPELEGLGVESWTSDAVARYVRAWVARP